MDSMIARHTVMPGKGDDSVSPYLRKPVRTYEDVTREQAHPTPPDPKKESTEPGGPGTAEHSPRPGE